MLLSLNIYTMNAKKLMTVIRNESHIHKAAVGELDSSWY